MQQPAYLPSPTVAQSADAGRGRGRSPQMARGASSTTTSNSAAVVVSPPSSSPTTSPSFARVDSAATAPRSSRFLSRMPASLSTAAAIAVVAEGSVASSTTAATARTNNNSVSGSSAPLRTPYASQQPSSTTSINGGIIVSRRCSVVSVHKRPTRPVRKSAEATTPSRDASTGPAAVSASLPSPQHQQQQQQQQHDEVATARCSGTAATAPPPPPPPASTAFAARQRLTAAGNTSKRVGTPTVTTTTAADAPRDVTPTLGDRQVSYAHLDSPQDRTLTADLSDAQEGVDWSRINADPRELLLQQQQQQQRRERDEKRSPTPDGVDGAAAMANVERCATVMTVHISDASPSPLPAVGTSDTAAAAPLQPPPSPQPEQVEQKPQHVTSVSPLRDWKSAAETTAAMLFDDDAANADMNIFVAVRVRPHTVPPSASSRTKRRRQRRSSDGGASDVDQSAEEDSVARCASGAQAPTQRVTATDLSSFATTSASFGSLVRGRRSTSKRTAQRSAREDDDDDDDDVGHGGGGDAAGVEESCVSADAASGVIDCTVAVAATAAADGGGSGQRVRTLRLRLDHILDETVTQAEVMQRIGARAVARVLQGYHGTVMCYGQSGSGKTYTVAGPQGGKLSTKALDWLVSRPLTNGGGEEDDDGNDSSGDAKDECVRAAAQFGLLPRMLLRLFAGLHAQHSAGAAAAVAAAAEEEGDEGEEESMGSGGRRRRQHNSSHDGTATATTAATTAPLSSWTVTFSALELYNEELRDLLPGDLPPPKQRPPPASTTGSAPASRRRPRRTKTAAPSPCDPTTAVTTCPSCPSVSSASSSPRQPAPPVEYTFPCESTGDADLVNAVSPATTSDEDEDSDSDSGSDSSGSDTSDDNADGGSAMNVDGDDGDDGDDDDAPSARPPTSSSGAGASALRRGRGESSASASPPVPPMRTRVSRRVGGRGKAAASRHRGVTAGASITSLHGSVARCLVAPPLQIRQGAPASATGSPPTSSRATSRQTPRHGGGGGGGGEAVYVEGLREHRVRDVHEAMAAMRTALRQRQVGSTELNKDSSRSHAFFFVRVEQRRLRRSRDGTKPVWDSRLSTLTLVDLAGSERVSHTGAHGVRLKEAQNINLSLSALGNVMRRLSSAAHVSAAATQGSAGVDAHIPYRDSKLTRILQSSLGGNALTFLLCNISPDRRDAQETMSTLRFARLAKDVKNSAVVNETTTDTAADAQAAAAAAAAAEELRAAMAAVAAAEEKVAHLVGDAAGVQRRLRQLATYAWWLEDHLGHFAATAAATYQQQQQQQQQCFPSPATTDTISSRRSLGTGTGTGGSGDGDGGCSSSLGPLSDHEHHHDHPLSSVSATEGTKAPPEQPTSPAWWRPLPRPATPVTAAAATAQAAAVSEDAAAAYWDDPAANALLSPAYTLAHRRAELQRKLITAAAAVAAASRGSLATNRESVVVESEHTDDDERPDATASRAAAAAAAPQQQQQAEEERLQGGEGVSAPTAAALQARLEEVEHANVILRLQLAELQDHQQQQQPAEAASTPVATWPPHYTPTSSDASLRIFLARCGFTSVGPTAATTAALASRRVSAIYHEALLHALPLIPATAGGGAGGATGMRLLLRRRASSKLWSGGVVGAAPAVSPPGEEPVISSSSSCHRSASSTSIESASSIAVSPASSDEAPTSARRRRRQQQLQQQAQQQELQQQMRLGFLDDLPPTSLAAALSELDAEAARTALVHLSQQQQQQQQQALYDVLLAGALLRDDDGAAAVEEMEDLSFALMSSASGPHVHPAILNGSVSANDFASGSMGGGGGGHGGRRWGQRLLDRLRATLAMMRALRRREDFCDLEDVPDFHVE